MKKIFTLWALVAILTLGIAPFAHGGEPNREPSGPPTQLVPKETAPGPVPNPPVARQIQYPPGCSDHTTVVETLKQKFQEIPLIIGVTKKNYLFELFGSDLEDGTFSLVLTNTKGVACMVDSGTQLNFLLDMVPVRRAESQDFRP